MKPDTWCESEAGNSESLDHWLCRSGLSRRTINKRFLPWVLNGKQAHSKASTAIHARKNAT